MIAALAGVAGLMAAAGVAQALVGAALVERFARRRRPLSGSHRPVSVLKPLHGDEPMLFEALSSLCRQAVGPFQVVCGVQDPGDPAIAVVGRLQQAFPGADIALVVDATQHGPNRKVGNLINMLPTARHDVLVIADSDVH
ncbi:MAG TPA: glycosyltransferase, partial [Rhodopila sp.]|uniref:glycosyltransferase n=1 Tax=Rhodopila sp. TaxID=2480087 RepID=UPI002C9F9E8A